MPPRTLLGPAEQTGNFLRKVIDTVRSQDFPYDRRAPKKVDWRAYDLAQAHEMADMLQIIRLSVEAADRRLAARSRRRRGRGQPPTPAADVAKVLLMQSYLGVPNRVAEGIVRLLGPSLGLSAEFSYKTVERGYSRADVDALLDEVVVLSNLPVKDLEKVFSVDGSGSPTRKRQNYADSRSSQRRVEKEGSGAFPKGSHDFVYSVFVVGAVFKLIAAYRNTLRHDVGELAFFPELARATKEVHPSIEMMVGDGIYAGRPQVDLVTELGAVARFLPRRNITLKRFGSVGWVPMLMAMYRDPQGWLREYYQREASETANSVIKNDNPQPLRKRLTDRRLAEDHLRAVCYNLKRLCYLHYLVGFSVTPMLRSAAG
ncbi:MAG: hypothetical protein ACREBZ_05305 [Thermoplasmata archaeon]